MEDKKFEQQVQCAQCDVKTRYRTSVKDYNTLAKEHNILVDRHNKLTTDAQSLLKFIEDLTRGMKAYARKGLQLGTVDPCQHVNVPGNLRIEEGRVFVAELHNLIADFLTNIKEGCSIEEAYGTWIATCHAVKSGEIEGGSILL